MTQFCIVFGKQYLVQYTLNTKLGKQWDVCKYDRHYNILLLI